MDDVWLYVGILVAAAVEGEVAYLAACALVAEGRLDPIAVIGAGSAGAAIGDQAYYYAFRGRLPRLIERFPRLGRQAAPLLALVNRHATLATALVRFAPGFRVALTAACVAARVPPRLFSTLNTVTSLVWAVALMVLVGWGGPAALSRIGLDGWQGAAAMGLVVLVLCRLAGRAERRALSRPRV